MRDQLNAFLDYPDRPVPHAPSGPLSGLTLAVKDIFDVAGYPTGGGHPHRIDDLPPASATAPAVQGLLDAGARFIGKTQTDELAFSMMGQNAHYPEPVNPAAPGRVTGGSSSGSVAAVAGGLADIATGSDTGGSVRTPASFCGLTGLRTTHGRISLKGAMPLAPSFDTFGWFAKDMSIYARVGEVLLGEDSNPLPQPRPLRIASLDTLVDGEAAIGEYARMTALAARVIGAPATAPELSFSPSELNGIFRNIQSYEAWAVHGDWISARDRQLGPGVRQRFDYGSTLGCEVATSETKRRNAFREELAVLLGSDGVLVMPTVPGPAPMRDMPLPQQQVFRDRAMQLLCLAGLSGFPQITIPLGRIDGAPFGLSLLGPAGSDRSLIALAANMLAH